jgi:hypothetical protein
MVVAGARRPATAVVQANVVLGRVAQLLGARVVHELLVLVALVARREPELRLPGAAAAAVVQAQVVLERVVDHLRGRVVREDLVLVEAVA